MTQAVAVESIPLRAVRVRVVRRAEEASRNALLHVHDYLGFRNFCRRCLRHVAVRGDRWLALLDWHAAGPEPLDRLDQPARPQRLFLVARCFSPSFVASVSRWARGMLLQE